MEFTRPPKDPDVILLGDLLQEQSQTLEAYGQKDDLSPRELAIAAVIGAGLAIIILAVLPLIASMLQGGPTP